MQWRVWYYICTHKKFSWVKTSTILVMFDMYLQSLQEIRLHTKQWRQTKGWASCIHAVQSGRGLSLLQKHKKIKQPPFLHISHFPFQDLLVFLPVGSPLSLSSSIPSSLAATPPSPAPPGPPGSGISSGMNANALPFYPTSETVESVVGE